MNTNQVDSTLKPPPGEPGIGTNQQTHKKLIRRNSEQKHGRQKKEYLEGYRQ